MVVARFITFLIIFAFAFAYITKWIYPFVMKFFNKETNVLGNIIRENRFEKNRCQFGILSTHEWSKTNDGKLTCKWCKKVYEEVKEEKKKNKIGDLE